MVTSSPLLPPLERSGRAGSLREVVEGADKVGEGEGRSESVEITS